MRNKLVPFQSRLELLFKLIKKLAKQYGKFKGIINNSMSTVTKLFLTSSRKSKKFNYQVLQLLIKVKFLLTAKRRSINMIRKITRKRRRKNRKSRKRKTNRKNTKKRRNNKNLKVDSRSLAQKKKFKNNKSPSIQVRFKQIQ